MYFINLLWIRTLLLQSKYAANSVMNDLLFKCWRSIAGGCGWRGTVRAYERMGAGKHFNVNRRWTQVLVYWRLSFTVSPQRAQCSKRYSNLNFSFFVVQYFIDCIFQQPYHLPAAISNTRCQCPHTTLKTQAQRMCWKKAGKNYFYFIINRR